LFHYEESLLAHTIHHLLSEKKISLDDSITKMDLTQADQVKVEEMVKNNVLGFHKISVYYLKKSRKEFVFIFASSQQEAVQFYTKTFYQLPLNCNEYPLDFQLARGNEMISFRDMRKELMSFPGNVGYFNKRL
jgi:hypothetical protein